MYWSPVGGFKDYHSPFNLERRQCSPPTPSCKGPRGERQYYSLPRHITPLPIWKYPHLLWVSGSATINEIFLSRYSIQHVEEITSYHFKTGDNVHISLLWIMNTHTYKSQQTFIAFITNNMQTSYYISIVSVSLDSWSYLHDLSHHIMQTFSGNISNYSWWETWSSIYPLPQSIFDRLRTNSGHA